MPGVIMDATPGQQPEQSELDAVRELVREGFAAAKKSGRADWQVMTTAVLKNRILQATSRTFDERAYGAASFAELMRLIPDLVELDDSTRPPLVTLLDSKVERGRAVHSSTAAGRLRPDLWDAVLDYSADGMYVWDGAVAIKVDADEAGDRPRFPTISADVMAQWREDFAERHAERSLSDWAERNLGTRALPVDLRKPWSQTIRSRALEILTAWFDEHGLEVPEDVILGGGTEQGTADHYEAEELRRFLLRCIAVMKPEELQVVQVPASVALRARK